MLSLFYLSLIFVNTISQNLDIDGDIDVNGPETFIPHTSVDEPAVVSLGYVEGCICQELPGKMSVFYGIYCEKFPKTVRVKAPILKFRDTFVTMIEKDDFQMLENLTYIEIESNLLLNKLESGCFRNMNKLTHMSLSFNDKLSYLNEDLFDGLINLQDIYLRNNGFKNIIDATQALSPKYVPKLLTLVLNRNDLREMSKNDFLPMKGAKLETLNLVQCKIHYIHPEVLKPLKNLTALRLGENLFSEEIITDLLKTSLDIGIPLQILNLYKVGFRGTPPKELLKIIANSSITYLNLGKNHFERLTDEMFPPMPRLETLVLRDTATTEITKGTFSGMTSLKHLVLSGNSLTVIDSGLLLNTLILLDVSSNSYSTPFYIPDYIFNNMSNLQKLQLSNNQIESISNSKFTGLENLIILELNNAQLSDFKSETFIYFKNLKRLNLENNLLGSDVRLHPELFRGLDNLQVLLLGGCRISNLSSSVSLFKNLPNLIYLGLQRNGLHVISSTQFFPLVHLKSVDLAENNISPWHKRIFPKSKINWLNIAQNKLLTITKEMLMDFSYLYKLTIDGNPFSCDCTWYFPLLLLANDSFMSRSSLIKDSSATCVSPKKWRRYKISEYLFYLNTSNDCQLIEITNNVIFITFLSIFMIFLTCLVAICYYYRWNIRYWLFLAQREIIRRRKYLRKIKLKSISDYNYNYDAFVSYSNEDRDYIDKLVNALENTEPHLKLCVYERDFQIGTTISDSVVQNIASSRRIILVISNSFAKSQWCRWEMYLAECNQMREEFEDGLILIVLEKVSSKYMTPFLKYIMKSRIYLAWESDEHKVDEFWDKLKCTLKTRSSTY